MSNTCYITMTDGTIQTATYGDRSADGPSVNDGDLVVWDAYKKVAAFKKGDWKSYSNSAPVTDHQSGNTVGSTLDKEDALSKMFAEINDILFSKNRY